MNPEQRRQQIVKSTLADYVEQAAHYQALYEAAVESLAQIEAVLTDAQKNKLGLTD